MTGSPPPPPHPPSAHPPSHTPGDPVTNTPPPPPESPGAVGATAPGAGIPDREVSEGKALAVLSYVLNFIGLPFWAVPLVLRNNDFALYHGKQALMVWLAGIAAMALNMALVMTGVLACLTLVTWPLLTILIVVLNLIGLVNAAKGRLEPAPFVGRAGEEWFAGIRKAA